MCTFWAWYTYWFIIQHFKTSESINRDVVTHLILWNCRHKVDIIILSLSYSFQTMYNTKLCIYNVSHSKNLPVNLHNKYMNDLLLSLKKSGSIPPQLYYKLRSSAGKTPLMYGLPKIHKPDVPLRPIISFIHSPIYQLSKASGHDPVPPCGCLLL